MAVLRYLIGSTGAVIFSAGYIVILGFYVVLSPNGRREIRNINRIAGG